MPFLFLALPPANIVPLSSLHAQLQAFIETSANEGSNVETAFHNILTEIYHQVRRPYFMYVYVFFPLVSVFEMSISDQLSLT